jgi:hypothetical protein
MEKVQRVKRMKEEERADRENREEERGGVLERRSTGGSVGGGNRV